MQGSKQELHQQLEKRKAAKMTIDQDLLTPTDQVRRDRWGRYLVLAPDGTKPVGYTRATTIAKALDDQGGLMNWRSRMVLLGVAQRPDLLALAATTDPTDKKELDSICERAAEAGGATVRRDLGTALHGMLHRRWLDPNFIAPEPYNADVEAVVAAIEKAGLKVADGLHERIVVNDNYQIAGTFDLILQDSFGTNYIADIKTGSSVEFGSLSFAIQLAIYANADALYTQGAAKDGSEDRRDPMPTVSQTEAFILHVEPASGVCNVHVLDLQVGLQALELAMQVRQMRKIRPLQKWQRTLTEKEAVEKVQQHFENAELVDPDSVPVTDTWRDWARKCIKAIIDAGLKDYIKSEWPTGVPTLASGETITRKQGEQLSELIYRIGAEGMLEFFDREPDAKPLDSEPLETPKVKSKFDEGEMVTELDLKDLSAQLKELEHPAKQWVNKWSAECTARGVSIALKGEKGIPSQRRYTICQLLTELAPHYDNSMLLAVLSEVTGNRKRSTTMQLGSLTLEQAQEALTISQQINNGQKVVTWDDKGNCLISG